MTTAAGSPAHGARSFADLHSHSRASFDSLADPAAMIERALRLGLTHLAITDHERIDGAQRAAELAGDRLQVIVGEEVRSRDGDLIGLYLVHAVEPGLSAVETAAAIHEQGGLVGLPHPFDGFRASGGSQARGATDRLDELAAIIDYVEAHNGRAYRDANPQAVAFAARHALPAVASSDAHSVMEVGIASTVLPGPFTTAAELRVLLPQAQILPGRASYYVRLWTPAAKLVQRARGNRRIRASQGSTPDPEGQE
jgi:predicted metal-dependent phosphoesterase TrpH